MDAAGRRRAGRRQPPAPRGRKSPAIQGVAKVLLADDAAHRQLPAAAVAPLVVVARAGYDHVP